MTEQQKLTGASYLKSRLKSLPTSPGVYRMLNAKGDVLYVGKAKNLKNRITQYTQEDRLSQRIAQMVFHTQDLIIVETETEAEALLLEIQLIKSLKPKYNILFRDDTSYLKILITDEEAPQIKSYRGKNPKKGHTFGPYPSGDAVYKTIDLLERIFKLRTCQPSVFTHRTRPCLKYDIKRCSAPCVKLISKQEYQNSVQHAIDFLNGKTQTLQNTLTQQMQDAAASEKFEEAARLRDQLQALSTLNNTKQGFASELNNTDIIALTTSIDTTGKQIACTQIFHYRNSQSFGNSIKYTPIPQDATPEEALEAFLLQHYTSHTPPKELLITPKIANIDQIASALSSQAPYSVKISSPSRGENAKFLQKAAQNARNTLQRRLAETANWHTQMSAFGHHLGLKETPQVIECFDVSNISGKQAVTSMVVANTDGMNHKAYRLFNASTNTPNDYAMMAETLNRRYSKLFKNEDSSSNTLPSIVMIDGGIGHLNTAVEVFENIGLFSHSRCPALTAIAKGEERDKGLEKIYLYDHKTKEIKQLPIELNTPLIFMLQQIRDEAHRFAIGSHRKKRSKTLAHSGIEDIPNVGAKRKKALLLHFGSIENIKSAPAEEIEKVSGISKTLAIEIHNFFNG